MRRIIVFSLILLAVLRTAVCGAETVQPRAGGEIVRIYESESLQFSVERFTCEGARCYLTLIRMQDEAKQLLKGRASWRKNLMFPSDQAKRLPIAPMVVVNGSGFICPDYPKVPDDYPGRNTDYFYTSWGSLVVTDGEVLRNLDGVAFYGVSLEPEGLQMYAGEDNETVLSRNPIQTWSFYDGCALLRGKERLIDETWRFTNEKEIRTVIGRLEDGNLFLLTVTDKTNAGLTLVECTDFLSDVLRPEWAFNLDGGPSSALLVRPEKGKTMKTVFGNGVKTADSLAFCELE